ncbi:conjugative transfer protein TrbL [Micromonospora sp. B006]|nr:conjugative transfer protein TrbL [Micromonospora sp. B006]
MRRVPWMTGDLPGPARGDPATVEGKTMSNQPGSSTAAQTDQPEAVGPTTGDGAAVETSAVKASSGEAPTGEAASGEAPSAAAASGEAPAGEAPAAEASAGAAASGHPHADEGTVTGGRPEFAPGALVLALVSIGWLAAMLWSTREAIHSTAAGVTAISLSAYALPGVITAALVSGATVALAATNRLGRATLRFLAAVGTGLVVGLLAAVAINLTYADNATTNTIAGTTAAAAIIGGAMAGARQARVVGAITAATLTAQIFVVLFSRARDPLSDLFGAGETQQSVLDAAKWVSRTESLLAGLLAGLAAYLYLTWSRRRAERRDGVASPLRWPAYLVAGAGAGLLLLLTEVIIRIGGRGLLDLAAALSEADEVAQTALGTSRVDNGIWVLFVGALTTLIVFGRTLGPRPVEDETDEPAAS